MVDRNGKTGWDTVSNVRKGDWLSEIPLVRTKLRYVEDASTVRQLCHAKLIFAPPPFTRPRSKSPSADITPPPDEVYAASVFGNTGSGVGDSGIDPSQPTAPPLVVGECLMLSCLWVCWNPVGRGRASEVCKKPCVYSLVSHKPPRILQSTICSRSLSVFRLS